MEKLRGEVLRCGVVEGVGGGGNVNHFLYSMIELDVLLFVGSIGGWLLMGMCGLHGERTSSYVDSL